MYILVQYTVKKYEKKKYNECIFDGSFVYDSFSWVRRRKN